MLRPLLAAALAAGALLTASPAVAGTRCAGEQSTLFVCVAYAPLDPSRPFPEDVEVYCGGALCDAIGSRT